MCARLVFHLLPAATAILLALAAVAHPAAADVIPPDIEGCRNAAEGAACALTADLKGTCKKATCARLDYSRWNREVSAVPPSVEYECLRCVPTGGDGATGASPRRGADGNSAGGR
jgi:hypothetical protein